MKRKITAIIGMILMFAIMLISCSETLSVIGASVNEQGELVLEMSDGTTQNVGKVKGENGSNGNNGVDGDSAYQLYCKKYGYTGTEEEWLEEINKKFHQYTPEEIYEIAVDAIVTIKVFDLDDNEISTGSGFLISSEGNIVTAYHVIDGAYSMEAHLSDGGIYEVKSVIGFDMERDIALLKINVGHETSYLKVETEGITPGEAVYSIGSALGFLDGSFSSGVVAAKLREVIIDDETEETMQEVQFTAQISSGNSGGPLLNSKGNVVGIVTSYYENGNDLNLATYIGEIDNIDETYSKSVTRFFNDTEYFQIKLGQRMNQESEDNSTISKADYFYNGNTYIGITKKEADDIFKVVITGYEKVDFTIAYYIVDEEATIYYPLIYNLSYDEVELEWDMTYGQYDERIYYAYTTLSPGTYYIEIEGYYADIETSYALYAYWRPMSELINFKYTVWDTDFIS